MDVYSTISPETYIQWSSECTFDDQISLSSEYRCNKQEWLENALRKLYKKVHSLGGAEKHSSNQKKKLNVPITYVDPSVRREKKLSISKNEDISTHGLSEHEQKFWNVVEECCQVKSFYAEKKNDFFSSVSMPYKFLKMKGTAEENNEEQFIAEKIFLKLHKTQIKKATDEITKEVLEERNVEDTQKKCADI